jgi:hypothetical protein
MFMADVPDELVAERMAADDLVRRRARELVQAQEVEA